MELFLNTNYNFLGAKKKLYLLISTALIIMAIAAIAINGMPWGVDFRGGTLVYVKFTQPPNEDQIRAAMQQAGLRNARIQRYGPPANHEVIVALDQTATQESALDEGRNAIIRALESSVPQGKLDLNNSGRAAIKDFLTQRDPLRAGTDANQRYEAAADAITRARDVENGGVLRSFDQLKGKVDDRVLAALQDGFFLSNFAVRQVEVVGAQVSEQLRRQALLAVIYASIGMLIYLWFRFEMIYGVASVVAVVHDTLITIGIFALLKEEISLTVIAALLTLVGYSMNDTIVIFDRIRENKRIMRRESLEEIANRSINQTLGRTFLTSGLTFLTVLALLIWGGEVLHGFSLALTIGIIIGTYSTIGVASPLVVLYHEIRKRRGAAPAAPAESRGREKVRA